MKGNLSTLKKICRYASAVMLAGAFVLAALLVATVVMAAGSLLGVQALSEALSAWVGVDQASSTSGAAAVVEMLVVLSLGAVTVLFIHRFMKAIEREHSPFNEQNVDTMRFLSKTYLVAAPAIAVADWFARGSLTSSMFLFFGSIMVGVVVYCLALAFRYGSVLQKESDETLRGGDGYNSETGQGHGGQEDVPEPAGGKGRHLQREPLQHKDGEDLRHKVLHLERDLQGPGMPARGHPGVCGGRGGFLLRPPMPAPPPSSSC